MARARAHLLVDDDLMTGREAMLAGCKFIRSQRGNIEWALELQHFAATTKAWYVKQCHTARALSLGEWYTK